MHGNVWEWCLNRFAKYPGDPTPMHPQDEGRAIRGGNWYVPADSCRSANRCRLPPASQGSMLGFRVLRALPELSDRTPDSAPEHGSEAPGGAD
jgi:formylglycine-generating enzyme required for sulfatase activity